MKFWITILLLFTFITVKAESLANIKIGLFYIGKDSKLFQELKDYGTRLNDSFNNLNYWELNPNLQSDLKIRVDINVAVRDVVADQEFKGSINITAGFESLDNNGPVYRKTISYSNQECNFTIDHKEKVDIYEEEEDMKKLSSILKYYVLIALAESYDCLSYTDSPLFSLQGTLHYQKVFRLLQKVDTESEKKIWEETFSKHSIDFKAPNRIIQRRVRALVFNGQYLLHKKNPDRTKLFISEIRKNIDDLPLDLRKEIFDNFYVELNNIFNTGRNIEDLQYLLNQDKKHSSIYKNSLDRLPK